MSGETQRRHPRFFLDVDDLSEDEIVAMVMGYVDAAREQEERWAAEDRAAPARATTEED